MEDLAEIVKYIVDRAVILKNSFTDEKSAPVEFACVFCKSDDEYQKFSKEIKTNGKIVEDTPTGFTYLLNTPINTVAGSLRLVKIRKVDPERKERGDADFNTDYGKFKENYANHPKFELIKREDFEMLRLSDSKFDVLACFSNIPKSMVLKINL